MKQNNAANFIDPRKILTLLDIKKDLGDIKTREFCREIDQMENAELYSSANGMQKKDAKEILAEFREKLNWRKECRILDVGCGSGEVTTEILLPLLPKDFKELIGLDLSLEMIQHARNLHSHPKVSFIQFDIADNTNDILEELAKAVMTSRNDNLDLKEINTDHQRINILINNKKNSQGIKTENKKNGYDVLCSFYCLHWVSNQRLALKNIQKLLRPGGEALLVFLAKSPIFTLYRKLSSIEPWKVFMQDVDSFIPFYQDLENPLEKFIEIVKSGGFKILTTDCRDRSYVFESVTSLRNAIKAVNPFLPRIPDDMQEEFINDCIQQTKILKLTEFRNGCCRVSYKLIIAHVRKPL